MSDLLSGIGNVIKEFIEEVGQNKKEAVTSAYEKFSSIFEDIGQNKKEACVGAVEFIGKLFGNQDIVDMLEKANNESQENEDEN